MGVKYQLLLGTQFTCFYCLQEVSRDTKNIFYSTTYHGYVLMQGCADWDGVGERHAPPIFSNLQERWSKGSHAVRELAKVFSAIFFFLVTVVGQLVKMPLPQTGVSVQHCSNACYFRRKYNMTKQYSTVQKVKRYILDF